MSPVKHVLTILTLVAVFLGGASAQAATPSPAWSIRSVAVPTHFVPGDAASKDLYELTLANKGAAPSDKSPITITDTLPSGLVVEDVELLLRGSGSAEPVNVGPTACETQVVGEVSSVSCEITEALSKAVEPAHVWPGEGLRMVVHLDTPASVSGPLENLVEVQGGGAESVSAVFHNEASAEEAHQGFQEFRAELTGVDGQPVTGAASHPYQYTTSFAINTVLAPPTSSAPFVPAGGDVKDVEVALPPGLVGNPNATDRCSAQRFNTPHIFIFEGINITQNECPDAAAVGIVAVQQLEGQGGLISAPLYNLVPPPGMPAQLGFQVLGAPFYIDTSLRSDGDYGISAHLRNVSEAKRVTAAAVTIWGNPADERHDRLRGNCNGGFSLGDCPSGLDPRPFMRLPTSCEDPLATTMSFDTWTSHGTFVGSTFLEPAPVDCHLPDFSPTIKAKPTTVLADSPSGLDFNLHIPQKDHEDPEGLGQADLRNATVTLPADLVVNPASAAGRAACTPAQVGLSTPIGQQPPSFDKAPASCPSASKLATVEVKTPLLEDPVPGAVYLAEQGKNPFSSLIAIYLVLEDPQTGIVVKLAGRVSPDPVSGQLTTTFSGNPQLPVEDFELNFFGGARAPLRTPACGTHATTSSLTPWSAPGFGPPAAPGDPFQISSGPDGGACPSGALAPRLTAGLANPAAATFSPFSLRLTRADGSGELAAISVTAPKGLSAKLAGVFPCPESSIAAAIARGPGQGNAELTSPSCPLASRVGSVSAGAGAGPTPYYAGGDLYLSGPYKGAPLSLVAIVPAVAGPFDLGVVVNRISLRVDPESAQVTAVSDPLPTILSGIPLDVKDVRVSIDRTEFTLAPTSCSEKAIDAVIGGKDGSSAQLSDRFQVGGCRDLGFAPKLSLNLEGGTKRGDHPAFRAVLKARRGDANIGSATVALPRSEFLDQANIRTICTRVQFAVDACPKGSIYGKAEARTPLLDYPISGPVYLRSSSNKLPDLVVALRGPAHQPIEIDLVGRIDSKNGGIRTSFESAPDAPLSRFTLTMKGGKRGLLVNSRSICAKTFRAKAHFSGQNGKLANLQPPLRNPQCAKARGGGKGRGR